VSSVRFLKEDRNANMASAVAQAYMGVWGKCMHPVGSRGKAPGQGAKPR